MTSPTQTDHRATPVHDRSLPPGILREIDESRRRLLRAIGNPSDLTFIRGRGNLGDELIWAGTRELLSGRAYREIGVEDIATASGDTALLAGGGAWCKPFHGLMPRILEMAELCFRRVIVLPSTFDASVPAVRRTLARSNAMVFARERESLRQIAGICNSDIAHDAAFFFAFEQYRETGRGVLHAFRNDSESSGAAPTPHHNEDISLTCGSLEEWVRMIASHELVRTDRAHVMIAAALLGKRVEYWPSNYHKVTAIADYALHDLPVFLQSGLIDLHAASVSREEMPNPVAGGAWSDLTIVVPAFMAPGRSLRTLRTLDRRARVLLLHRGPDAEAESCLAAFAVGSRNVFPGSEVIDLRELVLKEVNTAAVLIVDPNIQLEPGAVELLCKALQENGDLLGVSALVVDGEGRPFSVAGVHFERDGLLCFRPSEATGEGVLIERCTWITVSAAIIRRSAFAIHDGPMRLGNDSSQREWCYRIAHEKGAVFALATGAKGIYVSDAVSAAPDQFLESLAHLGLIEDAVRMHRELGLIPESLCDVVPEIVRNGVVDGRSAHAIIELTSARGTAWMGLQRLRGKVPSLLERERTLSDLQRRLDGIHGSRWRGMVAKYWALRAALRKFVDGRPS